MEARPLGASGIGASKIGLGTWVTGGWMWGAADRGESIRAIHAALDEGIDFIDTAPMYGFGLSEEIVGEALAGRRDRVVLATKCGLIWDEEAGDFFFLSDEKGPNPAGKIKVHRCLKPRLIRREIEESLRRLKTTHIDLYQTHWQESTTPIADTMAELLKLKAEGKIRALGCSNANPAQMDAYRAAGQLDADQELFSMLDRKQETQNLPYCKERNLAFLAYSPLAQGLLTGKVRPGREFPEGDQRRGKPRYTPENLGRLDTMLAAFRPIADGHGATLTQLAIAWTVAQPGCTHALVGARTAAQAVENAGGARIRLTEAELNTMRDAVNAYTASGGA